MKKHKDLKIEIEQQGAPVVNCGWILKEYKDVATVEIDMRSKYCEYECSIGGSDGTCGIGIGTSERSLYLDESKPREHSTIINFPQFVGWNIFAVVSSRYTVAICFVKD
ncbi:MAG: hypothetical protein WCW65_03190 [Candidatus Paceibacterota bacterium]